VAEQWLITETKLLKTTAEGSRRADRSAEGMSRTQEFSYSKSSGDFSPGSCT
jgi:L-aminopeptidase/D-esterase-like protein